MAKNIIFFICICICLVGCQNKQELKDSGENIQIIENNISSEIEEVKNVDDNSSVSKIKILKEIDTSLCDKLYDPDWDSEAYKYPLEQKYLCDTYENEKLGLKKIEVYFCGYQYNDFADYVFEININGIKEEVVGAWKIFVIDLDESDDYLEIATEYYYECGGSIEITRVINNDLFFIGSMSGYSTVEDYIYINEKIADDLIHFLEETITPRYYIFENNKLIIKFMTYEEVKDKEYTITEETLSDLQLFPEEYMQVGDKIKILSISDETDTIMEVTNGINLRVMNESGEVFNVGWFGPCT